MNIPNQDWCVYFTSPLQVSVSPHTCSDMENVGDMETAETEATSEASTVSMEEVLTNEEQWVEDPVPIALSTGRYMLTHPWRGRCNFRISRSSPDTLNMETAILSTQPNFWMKLTFETDCTADKNFRIRALPYYVCAWDHESPVVPCQEHSVTVFGKIMRENHTHLLIVKQRNAKYEIDVSSGRRSVVVPNNGGFAQTIAVKFMDRSACVGGINRRRIAAAFTLESKTEVLGRVVLNINLAH